VTITVEVETLLSEIWLWAVTEEVFDMRTGKWTDWQLQCLELSL